MYRKLFSLTVLFFYLLGLSPAVNAQNSVNNKTDNAAQAQEAEDPDLPQFAKRRISKDSYLAGRNEQLMFWRGMPYPEPDVRSNAIYDMMRQEIALRNATGQLDGDAAAFWQPLGPAPIPNGQTNGRTDPVSGRTVAIAVHPTNPNIVYVGTAQGGLYRTLDGGTTWTPLLDNALSLAIGAVAISPSDPTTVFVGTGEAGLCGSGCFIGVGLYRITNAETSPVIAGPLTSDTSGNDVFTGRAVGNIAVHPTNPNILFVSTTSGVAGIGASTAGLTPPTAGLYRTTNALAANPTFQRLPVSISGDVSRSIVDVALDPGNPNHLIATLVGSGGDGGVYVTTNALAATPTFTRTLTTGDGATLGRAELAVQRTGSTLTVYAATGTGAGTLFKSTDGGLTFPQSLDNNFCSPQCFYDIAVDVDPNDANKVYLGGSPTLIFARSVDGGQTFTTNAQTAVGLHVDTHAIAVAPSQTDTIYFGSDGGIWKSTNAGTTWTSLNNGQFSATQFEGIALHPTDRNFMIGGTQDNGTQWMKPNGTWIRATGGDGGYSVIDQNATDTVNVTAYHTFFNQAGTQIGYQRITSFNAAATGTIAGTFKGCTGTGTQTGINCNDPVLFYAPITRGPGNPNTTYIGTNKLYRSADRGDNHTVVSQTFPGSNERASAIGISPQNDNVRIVGTTLGRVYATTTGSTTLTDVTGPIPARFVARAVIDPNNVNTAYVTLNGFGLPAGQHVWKTTDLNAATPTWTVAGNGIPDVPVNAFVVDPANSNTVYAGTDIGVYRSTDGGTNWTPFSDGLPRVAVFDMAIQPVHRVLRIATHGKGIWEMNLQAQANKAVADFDGDGRTDLSVFRPNGGNWFLTNSSNGGFRAQQFGATGDVIAPGDYDGDNRTDFAVFRNGNWFILNAATGVFRAESFGSPGDRVVVGDYDGDNKSDLAVYRPSTQSWYIRNSSNNQFRAVQFGLATDLPAQADFDADGKTDTVVFRPSNGTWYGLRSSDGGFFAQQFGAAGDRPVAADYDGDGRADYAVFRPSNGTWFLQQSTAGFRAEQFGTANDIPAQGDFDGDGRTDFAVFRPSDGAWYIKRIASGSFSATQFGTNGDVPVTAGYNPQP